MNTLRVSSNAVRVKNTPDLWCSICGSPMYEVDSLQEGQYSFVWYECSKQGCNGQWLHRSKVVCHARHTERISTENNWAFEQ